MRIVASHALPESALRPLAEAQVRELGHAYPEWTIESQVSDLQNAAGLPHTRCIVDDAGRITASATLLADDEVDAHAHLRPWLGDVYVVPDARGEGLGTAVVDAVLSAAHDMGFTNVHLVTDSAEHWYLHRGWTVVGDVTVHGVPYRHLQRELPA